MKCQTSELVRWDYTKFVKLQLLNGTMICLSDMGSSDRSFSRRRDLKSFVKFLCAVVFLITSCGNSNWSKDQENEFMDECKAEGGSGTYCKCFMEKVAEKYPNYTDSENLDFETAVELAELCE